LMALILIGLSGCVWNAKPQVVALECPKLEPIPAHLPKPYQSVTQPLLR
jgi:hypothetical protein